MKIGAQHEVLNVFSILDLLGAAPSGASLVGVLLENPCKNKREHQENDARNGSCCCVEVCFGYRASMRNPIERAGLGGKNSRAPIVESL